MTTPETNIADELDRMHQRDAERRARLIGAAQLLDAELSVLTIYDDQRGYLGHDYGNGQRHSELIRLRRELDQARIECRIYGYGMNLLDLVATPDQTKAALQRLSSQRLRRYQRDAHLGSTAQRAITAWQRTARELERNLEAYRAVTG